MNALTASDPVAPYWQKLAHYLAGVFSRFGDPAALARRVWLTRREHRQFNAFIRPLENMARALILIAALERAPITLLAKPERKARMRLAMPINSGVSFDMEKPETWRVSFKFNAASWTAGVPAGETVGASPRPASEGAGAPSDRVSSAPSAERLEALLRAISNPERCAAALARKLAADACSASSKPKRRSKRRRASLADFIALSAELVQRAVHATRETRRADSS